MFLESHLCMMINPYPKQTPVVVLYMVSRVHLVKVCVCMSVNSPNVLR